MIALNDCSPGKAGHNLSLLNDKEGLSCWGQRSGGGQCSRWEWLDYCQSYTSSPLPSSHPAPPPTAPPYPAPPYPAPPSIAPPNPVATPAPHPPAPSPAALSLESGMKSSE